MSIDLRGWIEVKPSNYDPESPLDFERRWEGAVFSMMEALAALYGEGGGRLVVWFHG